MRCWLWTGPTNGYGYGRAWVDGRKQYVHRLAYEAFWGPVPPGLELDHLCRQRACYNPWHLEAVTHGVNMERAAKAAPATICKRGHPITGTKRSGANGIQRYCLTCNAERSRRRRAA